MEQRHSVQLGHLDGYVDVRVGSPPLSLPSPLAARPTAFFEFFVFAQAFDGARLHGVREAEEGLLLVLAELLGACEAFEGGEATG